MNESTTGDVTLHNVSSHIMDLLIEYIYKRDLRVNAENAAELFVAGDMLQISPLVGKCLEGETDVQRQTDRQTEKDLPSIPSRYVRLDSTNCPCLLKFGLRFIIQRFINITSLVLLDNLDVHNCVELLNMAEFFDTASCLHAPVLDFISRWVRLKSPLLRRVSA